MPGLRLIFVDQLGADVDAGADAARHGAVVGVETEHPVDFGAVDVLLGGETVGHPDALDDQRVSLELDLTNCFGTETTVSGGDAPCFQGAPEGADQSTARGRDDIIQRCGVRLVLAFA